MSDITRRNLLKTAMALPLASMSGVMFAEHLSLNSRGLLSEKDAPNGFPLVRAGRAAPVFVDAADHAGVIRAATDLTVDIERVTGVRPVLGTCDSFSGNVVVFAGTLGKSGVIDALIKRGKIDVSRIAGQWESFLIATVDDPLPNVSRALVIAGSDKRGTIYGIYEVSEQIGVSPWYWWADVPVRQRKELWLASGSHVQGPPAVKYRGIFINDEDPCLGGWSREKFGGVNSKMYVHMFELLLRLKGNYLWPAMWGKAFNEDDPDSPRLADEYGIVMGTSHHEPMLRAQKEWTTHHQAYGNGEWNYVTNSDGLKKFWAEGIRRNRNYESVVTMGMRGDGDMAMPDAGGFDANKKLLERIITDQRAILSRETGKNPAEVPQLWALFTEVQSYYDAGLTIPDDVTLLFTDDNVGNLRRVPTAKERLRKGGCGIYFHMDMNGGPFSYKWLNSNPLPKIWEQMNLAREYGATQIWIANVGDLKPLEIPLEFFLRMAWNPNAVDKDKIVQYQINCSERDFGKENAAEIAAIVSKYAKYNGWRKPELLKPDTFSLLHYREAERVETAWRELEEKADNLNSKLPMQSRDAFYELVLHPVKACANLNHLYIAAARNALFAKQGRASTNAEAARVRQLFERDQQFSDYYNHSLAGGKWNHMMDQTHIGYTSWQSPFKNIMPRVTELAVADTADVGVALEGSSESWPGSNAKPELPVLDSVNGNRTYVDVFARGSKPLRFRATANKPWILLDEAPAPESASGAGQDRRVWVAIDWTKAPEGKSAGVITVDHEGGSIGIAVKTMKANSVQRQQSRGCFGGLVGPIAFDAEAATRNVAVENIRWEKIPDYGRGPSGMEIFPVTARSFPPPQQAPYLEYPLLIARPGKYNIQLVTGPTLDAVPQNHLGISVSMDQQPLVSTYVFTQATTKDETFLGKNCYINDRDNARMMRFTLKVDTPGRHTLRLTMIDPSLAVEKIILYDEELPYSFFGPPSRLRNGVQLPISSW
jgi:hypothetical protein